MKITPLEIRQKTFEKNFRGYEKDEVHAFLLTLSQEWERLLDENKEFRLKLDSAEREVQKLREVEGSLYKTLKTAEDTGANVIEQARKAADLHLRESQLKADAILQEAKTRARDTIEESETRAKEILMDMEDRLKAMVDSYKKLESSREDLLGDLKRLASDLLDRVERSRNSGRDFDADRHLSEIKRETKKIVHPNFDERISRPEVKEEPKQPKAEAIPTRIEEPVVAEDTVQQPRKQKSFFDEIG